MSRGIRIGNKVGYPVIKADNLNLSSLTLTPSVETQSVEAPQNVAYGEVIVNAVDHTVDSNIIPDNIKDGVEILGIVGEYGDYYIEKKESGVNLQNGGITSVINFHGITEIDDFALAYGYYKNPPSTAITPDFSDIITIGIEGLKGCFYDWGTKLEGNVSFDSLTTIRSEGLAYCFTNCTALTSLSFPALTSNSFGSAVNQFNGMLTSVNGCVVHFPSNLESVIGGWTSVEDGFDGTNTTVLFDLTATQ